jgi:hypothetical protein
MDELEVVIGSTLDQPCVNHFFLELAVTYISI